MQKKLIVVFTLLMLILLIFMTGCDRIFPPAVKSVPTGMVKGYVTDGRGGPGVEGAKISWMEYTTTTDSSGYFELKIAANNKSDLLVEKDGRAGVRVQDVIVGENENKEFAIPSKRCFHPDLSTNPPTISLNLNPGDELEGSVTVNISISGDCSTYLIYVYLGGEQRSPREDLVIGEDERELEIDTTKYPNGKTYLRILAYDDNNNAVLCIVPLIINNPSDVQDLPGDIPNLKIQALTFGKNVSLYSKQRREMFERFEISGDPNLVKFPNGIEFDLTSAPEDATILNRLTWGEAENADGYAVYRSFDDLDYELIGHVQIGRFDDVSPNLAVNKMTYYKVVPYNGAGEGNFFKRFVAPLPSFNVYLEGPANKANNVSLTPTLSWQNESSSAFPAEIYFYSGVSIFDATDYLIWLGNVENDLEVSIPEDILAPGGVYSWDVVSSQVLKIYSFDNLESYAAAFSAAGEYTADGRGTGSINGEFVFTTMTDIAGEIGKERSDK